jgi:hypothetical protein
MEDMLKGFVNLTPHDIKVVLASGYCKTIPTSGMVARVETESKQVGTCLSVPLFKTTFGNVQDLPEQRDNILLIVSAMVRNALPNRNDLISPKGLIRDGQGNVLGCEGFDMN